MTRVECGFCTHAGGVDERQGKQGQRDQHHQDELPRPPQLPEQVHPGSGLQPHEGPGVPNLDTAEKEEKKTHGPRGSVVPTQSPKDQRSLRGSEAHRGLR